ncbi:MAG TPA: hypothetical protein VHK67_05805 [Rhabdochlamydiaceae bacterium]|jgi:hypothetical protein|nr:hypothetical protein [Rhabdochlamydiaceae bacterium]
MPVEGLPPVSTPTSTLPSPISTWGAKLVSPLGAPLMSKDAMVELAGRIYLFVALVIVAAIVCAVKFGPLSGRASSEPDAKPTAKAKQQPGPNTQRSTPSSRGHGNSKKSSQQPTTRTQSGSRAAAASPRSEGITLGRHVASPTPVTAVMGPELQISEALNQINKKWESFFADLKNIHAADAIDRSLKKFHRRFDQYAAQSAFLDYFKKFNHIETNFRYFKEMRESLFLAPIYIDAKGIIHQPEDGNCLYHSLREGLRLVMNGWVEEPLEHWHLRDKVVSWMKANVNTDTVLQGYLDRAVADYIEVRKGQYRDQREGLNVAESLGEDIAAASASLLAEEEALLQLVAMSGSQRYKWYLDQAGQPKFFASVAEMYAFSNLYPSIKLHIWRELGGQYTDSFDVSINKHGSLTINIAYNLAGNHFDLYAPLA